MSNLRKSLAHWEAATIDLAGEFAKTYFPGSPASFVWGRVGDVLQVENCMFRWGDVLDYIRYEASREEILQHHTYIRENDYSQTPFRFWRDQIKPKTETQLVEVRVIGNDKN